MFYDWNLCIISKQIKITGTDLWLSYVTAELVSYICLNLKQYWFVDDDVMSLVTTLNVV